MSFVVSVFFVLSFVVSQFDLRIELRIEFDTNFWGRGRGKLMSE